MELIFWYTKLISQLAGHAYLHISGGAPPGVSKRKREDTESILK